MPIQLCNCMQRKRCSERSAVKMVLLFQRFYDEIEDFKMWFKISLQEKFKRNFSLLELQGKKFQYGKSFGYQKPTITAFVYVIFRFKGKYSSIFVPIISFLFLSSFCVCASVMCFNFVVIVLLLNYFFFVHRPETMKGYHKLIWLVYVQ